MAVALITGASRGLGRALARTLAARNWALVLDARGAPDLDTVARELSGWTRVVALAGDVADPQHRAALAAAAVGLGTVDLLVNNASVLGPSPQPALADYPLDEFSRVYDVNVVAPLGLTQLLLPALTEAGGRIVNVSSDAAVEPYPGWGRFGPPLRALALLPPVPPPRRAALRGWRTPPRPWQRRR